MRRMELVGRRTIRLVRDLPVPEPAPGEVLVRVGACTVCNRSDLVYYHWLGRREHCAAGRFGHEVAGTVAAVGAGVTRIGPGGRVFLRTPLTSGYADYALAREVAVGTLPDSVPFEQGAILQLLPLAVHATRGVRLGDRVAILGQGPVGLMALQVARLRGAAEVVSADLDPWRLERSRLFGADRILLVEPPAAESAGALAGLGDDFDVAIDAVGTPVTVQACVDRVRQNGLVVLLGTHHIDTRVTFDLVQWERKGLRVHTSAEPTDAARATAMTIAEQLAARRPETLHLPQLLTHVFSLAELQQALDHLSASPVLSPEGEPGPHLLPPPQTLKVAIRP